MFNLNEVSEKINASIPKEFSEYLERYLKWFAGVRACLRQALRVFDSFGKYFRNKSGSGMQQKIKIKFTIGLKSKLKKAGLFTTLSGVIQINKDIKLELPCDIKSLNISKYPLKMGAFSYVETGTKNYSPLTIGRFCSIAEDVKIGLTSHPIDRASTSPYFYSPNWYLGNKNFKTIPYKNVAPVIIKDDVWIGANASIKCGVTIGKGAVVASGAIVTSDVEDFSIVGGVPAKVIGMRKIKSDFDFDERDLQGMMTASDFESFSSIRLKIKKILKKTLLDFPSLKNILPH